MKKIIMNLITLAIVVGLGVLAFNLINRIDFSDIDNQSTNESTFDWEDRSRLTHGFGTYNHDLEFNGKNAHYGNDYDLPEDTEVLAATDGTVTRIFKDKLGGKVLQISETNGQYYQWYMHLNEIKVEQGEQVKAGDVIALSGNTGEQTTGPHLHFQRMKGGIGNQFAEDPQDFIDNLPEGENSLFNI